jgi:hypothetical protein
MGSAMKEKTCGRLPFFFVIGDPLDRTANEVDVKYREGFGRDQLQLFQGVRYHYQRNGDSEAILIAIDH